jgi:phage terminase large subunit-like protein
VSSALKKKPAYPQALRVTRYAEAVLEGRIVAGRYVRQACQRHFDDLKHGPARGLIWRPERAEAWIGFFENTLFLKPKVPFKLMDFQAFKVGSIFGWLRADEDTGELRRRFRESYVEEGKGNGKTPMLAGIGLGGLLLDTEEAPEIYAAAVSKDQLKKLCFKDAGQMVRASPELSKRIVVLASNLSYPAKGGSFSILSSEDGSKHGLRIHMGLLDEIHAHATAAMVDIVEAGTKNCRNSHIALITNSGKSQQGPCWAYRQRALAMLKGKPDDSLFAYVCALDPCPKCQARGKQQPDPKCKDCDDWRDEKNWIKANPGLGTILDRDYVKRRVNLARTMPSKLNGVLQLNFCTWTQTDDGWLDMFSWRNRCLDAALTQEQFVGRPSYVGMDAANRVDCTCVAVLFEIDPGGGQLDPAKLSDAAKEALREALGLEAGARAEGAEAIENRESKIENAAAKLAAAGYALFLRTYVPEAMVDNASHANHEAYSLWAHTGPEDSLADVSPRMAGENVGQAPAAQQRGTGWKVSPNHWLIVTPGAITDFARIEADLEELHSVSPIRRLQADPRELGYLLQRVTGWLGEEVVAQVSQGPVMISQPMKYFEGLVAAGLIKHDGNPVLDWMLGNVVQKTTRTGGPVKYYYPVRPSDEKKIDAAPAAFMALDGALRAPEPVADPGMVVLG